MKKEPLAKSVQHAIKVQKGKRKAYIHLCDAIEEAVAKKNN